MMDRIDRKMLIALQEDGRISNHALADRVGLSPSPCLRRLRAMEAAGLIESYSALINRAKAGFPLTAYVRIRLQRHTPDFVEAFENRICRLEEVLECHLTSGSEDYLLQVVVESHDAYERFLRDRLHPIPGVAAIETSFALGVVKRVSTLPITVD